LDGQRVGGGSAEQDAGGTSGGTEQQRFDEKLGGHVAAARAQRTPEPDLGPPLQDGDDHHVGDADSTDEQGHRAEPEKEGGTGVRGIAERVGLLGGTLTVGPNPDGGFLVRTRLPVPPGTP
jgi:hypothetical protein